MLNGIKKVANGNSNSRLPPGLAAFVNDTNRANNNYSLKSLIKNENYKSIDASSWYYDNSYYDDLYRNEYNQIEDLSAQSEQLEILRINLENKLFKELRKGTTQQTIPLVHNIKKKKDKNTVNDLIKEMKEIIYKLSINTLNTDDIVEFIRSNGICWSSFDNRLCRKKVFALRLRNYFDSFNIKYGSAIKIWRQLNDIYNESHSQEIIIGEIVIPIPWKDRSLLYISELVTQNAIDDNMICEHFETSKQLFHYLRWTIKMQQIDVLYKVFKMRVYWDEDDGFDIYKDKELVIFNVELHDNDEIQSDLYIVGTNNNKVTVKSPRWKMKEFMTATQIYNKYGIKGKDLPIGSRANAEAFKEFTMEKQKRIFIISGYIRRMLCFCHGYSVSMMNMMVLCCYSYFNDSAFENKGPKMIINHASKDIYMKLPQIKTQQKKEKHKKEPREMLLRPASFYKYIESAINSNNIKHKFIKIVSFDKNKRKYFIDLLLPIKLLNNNWCGLIFRDYLHYVEAISICIDCNDIKTKSKLFDAAFNVNDQYKWMDNKITRLTLNLNQKKSVIKTNSIRIRCKDK